MRNGSIASGDICGFFGLMALGLGMVWALQALGLGAIWSIGAASLTGAGAGLILFAASLRAPMGEAIKHTI